MMMRSIVYQSRLLHKLCLISKNECCTCMIEHGCKRTIDNDWYDRASSVSVIQQASPYCTGCYAIS